MSDSRDVGYAAPWFRAPNEIYGPEPFQYIDGGQVLRHRTLGPVGIAAEGSYGNMTESYLELDTVDSVKVKSGHNVVAALEYGNEAARLTDLLRITELEVCVEPIGLLTFQWFRTNVA
jgi:hypothetical protein